MDEVLSGFRIGGAILWAWMLWRVLFESANIHEAPDMVRRIAWKPFRWFIILQGSAIVLFLAPENILRAAGKISVETSYTMLSAGSFLSLFAAILVHHGLDIATERASKAIAVYVIIALISIAYSLTAGVL